MPLAGSAIDWPEGAIITCRKSYGNVVPLAPQGR